ncbi:MAG TPA: tripartite tricarboxylate transporter substrate binding protein [Burkholderiales bacterium]|nr:tripartite tricarboxylate transporter substrate binding protein [Burkholderiales bacterium]
MSIASRRDRIALLALALLAAVPLCAPAQQFPARPVRLVVPYPPGGANDAVARLLAPRMAEQLGQNVVVDNRGGGNTIIGSELVAKAVPDGHTLLIIAAGHAINPSLYPKLPYDTARDFASVALVGDGAYVLVANPSLGIGSVPDLIAAAKAKPGQILYASSSTGNLTHLAAEVFNAMAGVKMLHVPYKGGGPAMVDLLGGRVSVFFSTVAVARPHLQSGKIRGLGVTTARRSGALPNIPTIAEAGLPGYDVSGWYGFVAPAATPKAAVAKLHAVVQAATRQADVKEKLLAVGVDVVESTTAQFGQRITSELAKWEKIVKPLGITPD